MDLKRFSRILKGKFRKNQNQSKNEKHGKRKKMRGNWLIRKEESGERHYFLSFLFFLNLKDLFDNPFKTVSNFENK